ncbi:hypothetical protein GCM10022408_04760 [Hymenobacter fastidiosus]|uniref:UrcA family protein n=1 Tax=Hymenobacter fastidiosus TaxID=486264 RepID=A0ABP7RH63_9BACT
MKTFLIARLSFFAVLFGLSVTVASAQTTVYTEDAQQAGTGYWSIETDQTRRDYSVIRFYTAQHEKIYEERLNELCLDPSRGTAKCRRTARQLSNALAYLHHAQSNTLLGSELGINRRAQRFYALR